MKIRNILWGILFIFVGVIFGLNALEITNIDIFFDGWWTLFIIVPCFISLFKESDKTGSLIGILIGIALLLACQGILRFELIWKLMIPIILIIIGCSFIFKDAFKTKVNERVKEGDLLLEFDRNEIQKEGYSLITPVVITNSNNYEQDELCIDEEALFGKSIINLKSVEV